MDADLEATEEAVRREIEAELDQPSTDLKRELNALAAKAMSSNQREVSTVREAIQEAKRQRFCRGGLDQPSSVY